MWPELNGHMSCSEQEQWETEKSTLGCLDTSNSLYLRYSNPLEDFSLSQNGYKGFSNFKDLNDFKDFHYFDKS